MSEPSVMTLRPYQILCAVCSLGTDKPAKIDAKAAKLLAIVKHTPDMPIKLSCNLGGVFAYQNPGTTADTPDGAEHNVKRDLEILHKLNLAPGATLPARIIFNRLLERIDNLTGICAYTSVTSDAWKGCPVATTENYTKGRRKGIDAIIPPRPAHNLDREKTESLKSMYSAAAIDSRPHLLLCAVCQYGAGTRPPFPEDNLPELLELMLSKPETRVRMVPYADWMMCAPCPHRAPNCSGCVNNQGVGGVSNQMRDLRVLQKVGLTFGEITRLRDLYTLIFERISGTLEICGLEHTQPSVWCTGCGAVTTNSANYAKGKELLLTSDLFH